MVLLYYLQAVDGLVDCKGPLSSELLSAHYSRAYFLQLFHNSEAKLRSYNCSAPATAASHVCPGECGIHTHTHSLFSCSVTMSPVLW